MKKKKLRKRLQRAERGLKLQVDSTEHLRRSLRSILIASSPHALPRLHDDVSILRALKSYIGELKDRPGSPGDPGAWWEFD